MVSSLHGSGARVVVSAAPDAVLLSLPPFIGAAVVVAPLTVVVVALLPAVPVVVGVVVAPTTVVVGAAEVDGVGSGVGANVKARLLGQLVRLPVVVRNVPLETDEQRSGMNEPDAAPKQAPEPSAAQ